LDDDGDRGRSLDHDCDCRIVSDYCFYGCASEAIEPSALEYAAFAS
jgi:hypothetical protein